MLQVITSLRRDGGMQVRSARPVNFESGHLMASSERPSPILRVARATSSGCLRFSINGCRLTKLLPVVGHAGSVHCKLVRQLGDRTEFVCMDIAVVNRRRSS